MPVSELALEEGVSFTFPRNSYLPLNEILNIILPALQRERLLNNSVSDVVAHDYSGVATDQFHTGLPQYS